MLIFLQNTKRRKMVQTNNKMIILIFFQNTNSRRKMVRTKGDGGASRTVASKAPRKALGGGGASSRWGAQCRKIFPNLTKVDQGKNYVSIIFLNLPKEFFSPCFPGKSRVLKYSKILPKEGHWQGIFSGQLQQSQELQAEDLQQEENIQVLFFNLFNVIEVFLMAYLHPKTAKIMSNLLFNPLHLYGCPPEQCPKTSEERIDSLFYLLWLFFVIFTVHWLLIPGGNSFNKEIGTPGWQKPLTSFFTVSIPKTSWLYHSCKLWFTWWP